MINSFPEFDLLILSLRVGAGAEPVEGRGAGAEIADEPGVGAEAVDGPGVCAETVADAERLIASSEINWELLYKYADGHSVKPQLYGLVSQLRREVVPEDFLIKLQDAFRQNLVDQLDHVSEFFRVAGRLEAEGVTVVPFKGFWMATAYYGDFALRESDDIDVFIRFSDLAKVQEVMPATGYLVGAPYLQTVNPRDCEFNYGIYSGGRCISHLEFHWRMAPSGFGLDITLEDLASQVVATEIQGQSLKAFSPCATLLLTVMHHGGKDAFVKLKQVYDVALILRRADDIDWQWLYAEARRFGCLSLVGVAAELASRVCGEAVPLQLKALTSTVRIGRLADDRARNLAGRPWGRRQTLERARCLEAPPWERQLRFGTQVRDWLFRIRSRDGFAVKTGLLWRFVRKALIPAMVPKRLHPLFMRKYVIPGYAREI